VKRIGEIGTMLAVTSNRRTLWRMASSGMLRYMAVVRTDVSEEISTSIIRVTRMGRLGTLAATRNRRTLWTNIKSVLTKATRRNIPNDAILHRRRENLKSFEGH
jgi:hypothetical protein